MSEINPHATKILTVKNGHFKVSNLYYRYIYIQKNGPDKNEQNQKKAIVDLSSIHRGIYFGYTFASRYMETRI